MSKREKRKDKSSELKKDNNKKNEIKRKNLTKIKF